MPQRRIVNSANPAIVKFLNRDNSYGNLMFCCVGDNLRTILENEMKMRSVQIWATFDIQTIFVPFIKQAKKLIMVLGLSVQEHLIWVQLMQLEFTMFDTSNNKFSAVCLSDEKSRISRMSFSEYPNKRISPYMEFDKTSIQVRSEERRVGKEC